MWTGSDGQHILYRGVRGVCYIVTELARCGNGWQCPNVLPEWARPDRNLTMACALTSYAGDCTAHMDVGIGGYVYVYDYIPAGNTGARSLICSCWPINI